MLRPLDPFSDVRGRDIQVRNHLEVQADIPVLNFAAGSSPIQGSSSFRHLHEIDFREIGKTIAWPGQNNKSAQFQRRFPTGARSDLKKRIETGNKKKF